MMHTLNPVSYTHLVRINDGNVGRNVKVCQRIFNTLLIVRDNCKSGNLRCCSGCGGDSTEMSFLAQLRERKRSNQIFKGSVGVFVEMCIRDRDLDGYML